MRAIDFTDFKKEFYMTILTERKRRILDFSLESLEDRRRKA